MYKQVGFQFDNITENDRYSIKCLVQALVQYYNDNDLKQFISEPTGKRATHRVRIYPDLPDDYKVNIWFMHDSRFRKCLIKDISESGAGVMLPFNDTWNNYDTDRPFTAMIEFPGGSMKEIICKSVIRYHRAFEPSNEIKGTLSALNSIINKKDKDYFPATTKIGVTLDYSKLGKKEERLDIEFESDDEVDNDDFAVHLGEIEFVG